ncbi:zinc finger transcriptional activator [Rhodotorula kratochvilovae]
MEPNKPSPTPEAGGKPARAKRTYRACQPCRARKLKCDLGDPDNPSDPPCRRCRRESRECVFVVRANAKTYVEPPAEGSGTPYTVVAPLRPQGRKATSTSVSPAGEPAQALPPRPNAHPYATPHVGGWSTAPSTSRQPYPAGGPGPPAGSGTSAGGPTPPATANYHLLYGTGVAPPTPGGYDPTHPHLRHLASSGPPASITTPDPSSTHPSHSVGSLHSDDDDDHADEDEDMSAPTPDRRDSIAPGPQDANVLLSSTLHNPSDALRLLATASSLRSLSAETSSAGPDSRPPGLVGGDGAAALAQRGSSRERIASGSGTGGAGGARDGGKGKGKEKEVDGDTEEPGRPIEAGWERWVPVKEGMVTIAEAEALLSFFETQLAPLYPLLSPRIFTASHLPLLTSRESLLLASMITISARYSSLPTAPRARAIHSSVADYIRDELIGLLDGSGELRHISSVEALLLLTEWPPITGGRSANGRGGQSRLGKRKRGWGGGAGGDGDESAEGEGSGDGVEDAEALLRSSAQYDGMSWSFIGCAVRLAQELGIHNIYFGAASVRGPVSWQEERCLRTWIYCYNADRHVSVRLGRNTVVQSYMSSSWWEQVTSHMSQGVRREGANEVWAERSLPQGLIAALMGTIQERLYPNKEITRSMLRTGHWESFIRSLDHELQMMLLKSRRVLQQGSIESTLLQMEFEYVRLYGNAIALRALQERLRRAVKANDLWFVSPSLLNLQEGQWVLDALAAAQSILDRTVNYLAPKGYLRLAPSRIFQRILFAATFLFKALAVGVVEHGQSKVIDLLDQAISALHTNAVDRQHIARGFAALLRRLQAQCKPTLLSRFGVRAGEKGENSDPAHAATPAALSPHPDAFAPPPQTGLAASSAAHADPALAPTPSVGPSMPPSTHNTPRVGFHALPPPGSSVFSPALQAHGLPPPGAVPANGHAHAHAHGGHYPGSALPYHAPPLSGSPFPPAGAHAPPWLSAIGEPTADIGGFKLGDAPGGTDYSKPFEWDPISTNLAVGVEQDLLFQSLWGSGAGPTGGPGDFGSGVNPSLNLFGTLVGEDFGLDG